MRTLPSIPLVLLLACSGSSVGGRPADGGPADGGPNLDAAFDGADPELDAGREAGPLDMGAVEDAVPSPDGSDTASDAEFSDADVVDADADAADMGPDTPMPEVLEGPADTWTWIDIAGTKCGNGSPTGLGLNVHPGATELLIYLDGGGACWNYATCFGVVPTALHLDGYDERTFDSLLGRNVRGALMFDREDPKNPLREASYVFLPYCTADIFAGDADVEMVSALGARRLIHFHGKRNMEAYLARVAATSPYVEHVIVAGSSAGGIGAAVSWPVVRDHFPNRRVDLIDDAGPPIEPQDGLWELWISVWNPTLPPDCPECGTSVRAVRNYARTLLTDDGSRIAFLSSLRDPVIGTFMGLRPIIFEERLRQMCEEFGDEPRAQCFLIPGVQHTLLVQGTDIESGGLPLWRWLELMLSGDEAWDTALP